MCCCKLFSVFLYVFLSMFLLCWWNEFHLRITWRTLFDSPVLAANCLKSLVSGLWFKLKYCFICLSWGCLNDVRIRFGLLPCCCCVSNDNWLAIECDWECSIDAEEEFMFAPMIVLAVGELQIVECIWWWCVGERECNNCNELLDVVVGENGDSDSGEIIAKLLSSKEFTLILVVNSCCRCDLLIAFSKNIKYINKFYIYFVKFN